MKNPIVPGALTVLSLIVGCNSNPGIPQTSNQSSITDSQIERKKVTLIYEKGADTPYTGTVTNYYRSGEKRESIYFENGLPVGSMTRWYRSGQIQSEAELNVDQTGHVTAWYENGQMQGDSDLYRGRPTGLTTEWYESGQMKSESNHQVDGRPGDGVSIAWHENGQMSRRVTFVDGRQQKEERWDENGNGGESHAGVEEALNMSGGAKAAVSEYYMDRGELPADNANAGLDEASNISGRYVKSIAVDSGIITVTIGDSDNPEADRHTLVLTPDLDNPGYVFWRCASPDIEPATLPPACR